MGRFGGMRTAETSQNSTYLDPGKYKLKIAKYDWKDDLPKGGSALFVKFEVLESNNPAHPVGSTRSWCQKKNRSFLGSVKTFCYAALGYDQDKPDHKAIIQEHVEPVCEEIMDRALEQGFTVGRVVIVEVVTKPLKETEGDFNLHKFAPAQPPPPVEAWAKFKAA